MMDIKPIKARTDYRAALVNSPEGKKLSVLDGRIVSTQALTDPADDSASPQQIGHTR